MDDVGGGVDLEELDEVHARRDDILVIGRVAIVLSLFRSAEDRSSYLDRWRGPSSSGKRPDALTRGDEGTRGAVLPPSVPSSPPPPP